MSTPRLGECLCLVAILSIIVVVALPFVATHESVVPLAKALGRAQGWTVRDIRECYVVHGDQVVVLSSIDISQLLKIIREDLVVREGQRITVGTQDVAVVLVPLHGVRFTVWGTMSGHGDIFGHYWKSKRLRPFVLRVSAKRR